MNLLLPLKQLTSAHPDIIERSLVRPFMLANRFYQLKIHKRKVFESETKYPFSNVPIDVILPTTAKDLEVLAYCIKGILENVKHPITNIKIVAPNSPEILDFCKKNKYVYIDEDSVLPIKKSDVVYSVNGEDRSGWIFQQFLKYSPHLSVEEHYLTVDTDTVLIRPQTYIRNGKILVLKGDDHYPPYRRMIKKLLGYGPLLSLSSVCHQNLFSKTELTGLKQAIEKHTGKVWYQAILDNLSGTNHTIFAENLTYAYWMCHAHKDCVVTEYFFNKGVNRSALGNFEDVKKSNRENYKSISFQHYLR
jgi:hypothetical protein